MSNLPENYGNRGPELPFGQRPKTKKDSKPEIRNPKNDLECFITQETLRFNFGDEQGNDCFTDINSIEGQYQLDPTADHGPVIIKYPNGDLYFCDDNVGRQTARKLCPEMTIELVKKVWNGEKL